MEKVKYVVAETINHRIKLILGKKGNEEHD
jgi:hypothetical protein